MRLIAVLAVALMACHAAPPPRLASNVSHAAPADPSEPISRDLRHIPRELYPDLALVRSFAHQHDAVSREGLAAGERVFEQIHWTGMTPARVAALLGEPTARDEHSWRYDLEYEESDTYSRSVFLKLRFANGAVDGIVRGDGELRVAPNHALMCATAAAVAT